MGGLRLCRAMPFILILSAIFPCPPQVSMNKVAGTVGPDALVERTNLALKVGFPALFSNVFKHDVLSVGECCQFHRIVSSRSTQAPGGAKGCHRAGEA